MSSRENEARLLRQNEVNLRVRETKWPPTSIFFFRMHLHRQPNANTKLDLRSPIFDRNNVSKSFVDMPCLRLPDSVRADHIYSEYQSPWE